MRMLRVFRMKGMKARLSTCAVSKHLCLCCTDADEIDFDGFLRMLRVGSMDHLDQYESRHLSSASLHAGSNFSDLSTVTE